MIELKRALMRLFVIFFLIRRHFPGCVRLSFQRMAPGRLDQSADEDFGVGGPFKPGAGNFLYTFCGIRIIYFPGWTLSPEQIKALGNFVLDKQGHPIQLH